MLGPKAHTLSLIAPIPASLIDLLTRELAFKQAREKLLHALEETRTHQKITQETRPPFLMLQRAKIRQEIESALTAANHSIELLERGVAKLDQSERQLHALIEQRIENHLRNSSDDYVRSLVAYYHREDWQRLQMRLEEYTNEFETALVGMVKTCEVLPRHSDITLQQLCGIMMQNALRAAQKFEGEITFINRISDCQNQQSGLTGATLTRQIALDWAGALHEIELERIGVAVTSLMHLAAKHDEVSQQALHALKMEADPAHFAVNSEPLSFQAKQWEIMRKAVMTRVNPADFEAIIEETEHFLESGHIEKLACAEDDVTKIKTKAASSPTILPPAQPETASSLTASPLRPSQAALPLQDAPSLRLRTRQPKEPAPPPSAAPTPNISRAELVMMKQELEQARALLMEEKSQLQARAQFLAESEALLRASVLVHQEREALLEQKSKDLRVLEAQLHPHRANSPSLG